MSKTKITLNGRIYYEAEHGRFDAALLDDDTEIARTYGDNTVQMFTGIYEDVKAWADSYGIEKIETPYFARETAPGVYTY